jgi:hypothetical protein
MAASILIIFVSVGLSAYWLRYTCLLLLTERAVEDGSAFPLFSFGVVREQIRTGAFGATLQAALDRDFAVLKYLIGRAPGRDIEARLLVWDYRLLRLWCQLTRVAFPAQAPRPLGEMADVLAVLAHKLRGARPAGERA